MVKEKEQEHPIGMEQSRSHLKYRSPEPHSSATLEPSQVYRSTQSYTHKSSRAEKKNASLSVNGLFGNKALKSQDSKNTHMNSLTVCLDHSHALARPRHFIPSRITDLDKAARACLVLEACSSIINSWHKNWHLSQLLNVYFLIHCLKAYLDETNPQFMCVHQQEKAQT